MARILVYNTETNVIERFDRNDNDPMPYSLGRTLLVREFKRRSNSSLVWTTTQTMQSWNRTRSIFGIPIYIGTAFRRIYENGHANMSQHYAGVAFDCGQTLSYANRLNLHNLASDLNVWTYVEPFYLTTSYVHFDKRYGTPACSYGGYPTVRYGTRGVYVMILQDALNTLGYNAGNIDGIFGNNTLNATRSYQRANGLSSDGICGCGTWSSITARANGVGRTSTTRD